MIRRANTGKKQNLALAVSEDEAGRAVIRAVAQVDADKQVSVMMALRGLPSRGFAKRLDAQVERFYAETGAMVDIFDLGKITDAGRRAYLEGKDVRAEVVAFVETIRKDKKP
jgi:hypothetical protein